uniref:Uncharacterized protein n=1 Tax=Candidatus Kentrum sp. TUN TaxID=2126343 RepID=A0A450ZD56_9GAMM|nr:MAG: hypothetical protein BECKTUN1418E_GA0071001_100327 [Candidatus Kentron sp. TUN]VFK51714.1 MAG: hypothetical protein BECKTUN1418F_GA0071002_100327 [Candidatus Kentron sp. TUN]
MGTAPLFASYGGLPLTASMGTARGAFACLLLSHRRRQAKRSVPIISQGNPHAPVHCWSLFIIGNYSQSISCTTWEIDCPQSAVYHPRFTNRWNVL